jgi:hypothetical protein
MRRVRVGRVVWGWGGPAVGVGLAVAAFWWAGWSALEWWAVAGALGLAAAGVGVRIAWRVHERGLFTRVFEADWKLCPGCAHDLAGIGEHLTCPECGRRWILREVREAWMDLLAEGAPGLSDAPDYDWDSDDGGWWWLW